MVGGDSWYRIVPFFRGALISATAALTLVSAAATNADATAAVAASVGSLGVESPAELTVLSPDGYWPIGGDGPEGPLPYGAVAGPSMNLKFRWRSSYKLEQLDVIDHIVKREYPPDPSYVDQSSGAKPDPANLPRWIVGEDLQQQSHRLADWCSLHESTPLDRCWMFFGSQLDEDGSESFVGVPNYCKYSEYDDTPHYDISQPYDKRDYCLSWDRSARSLIYPGTYSVQLKIELCRQLAYGRHRSNCPPEAFDVPVYSEPRRLVLGPKLSMSVLKSASKPGLTTLHLLSVTNKSADFSFRGVTKAVPLAPAEDPNVFVADVKVPWSCDSKHPVNSAVASVGSLTGAVTKLSVPLGFKNCSKRWEADVYDPWMQYGSPKAYITDKWGVPANFRFCWRPPSGNRRCKTGKTLPNNIHNQTKELIFPLTGAKAAGRYRWDAYFPAGNYRDSGSFTRRKQPREKPAPPVQPCYAAGKVRIYDRSNSSCSEARGVFSRNASGVNVYPWICRRTGYLRGSCYLPVINAGDLREHSFSFEPR